MAGKASQAKRLSKTTVRVESENGTEWAYPVGYWSALLATIGGLIYFLVISIGMVTGSLTFPPSDTVQMFGGIIILAVIPVLVVMMACLHTVTPTGKKAFSQSALAFTLLFAMAVSINRFSQLGVVRQSLAAGNTGGIDWFLAYGGHSILFGLEILGWSGFLGLALLLAAPLFSGNKLELWLRWLAVLYGVLGLTSAIAFLLASPLSAIGFVAWGLVLFIFTALLAIKFRRSMKE